MSEVNRSWAIQRLEEYLLLIEMRAVPPSEGIGLTYYELIADERDVVRETQVVEQILDRLLDGWRTAEWGLRRRPLARQREAAHRAIAALESAVELDKNLGLSGPVLSASSFHAWVWGNAASLWESGHYREAVGAALRSVNAHAQAKLSRRDASEAGLLADAFSTKPPAEGHPRLRLAVDDGGDTFANVQEGAIALARGMFRGVRNPLAHESAEEWSESEALELLACCSVLARWIDAAEVMTA